MPPRKAVNQPPSKSRRGNPEAILEGEIKEALGALPGVTVWKNAVGVAVYESGARVEYGVGGTGAPDLFVIVMREGLCLVLLLEVKTPDGVVEPHQRHWHAVERRNGTNVAVVRSVDDALAALRIVQATGRLVDGFEVENLPPLPPRPARAPRQTSRATEVSRG